MPIKGTNPRIRVGTAGWSIGRDLAHHFSPEGTALERYGSVFDCVEINSSFYRPHKPETYARWASSVPRDFRFSVKLPKAISHEARLALDGNALQRFAGEIDMLGNRLGAVLVQLPPTLRFDSEKAEAFFSTCSKAWPAPTLCEPRHGSWFEPPALNRLAELNIALVAADPARAAPADVPTAPLGLAYWRLHGSPRIYYSGYSDHTIAGYLGEMRESVASERWCIFDNTAEGEALSNALTMRRLAQG